MRSFFATVCFLSLVSAAAAHPECSAEPAKSAEKIRPVCTATWQLDGKCTGSDMWDKWHVTGRTNPPDAFIRPFLDVPIVVLGYELLRHEWPGGWRRLLSPFVSGHNDQESWFIVGSAISSQPDWMIALGPGEKRNRVMWPPGMGQIWPRRAETIANPLAEMIDLHGVCWGGHNVSIFLTVYYTPAEPQPSESPVISTR